MKIKKKWMWMLVLCVFIGMFVIFSCDFLVQRLAAGHTFSTLEQIAPQTVGLVLGCAQELPDGRRNLFFLYRMQAAARLYHEGKVEKLLLSGDCKAGSNYNEPADMKNALLLLGVPEKAFLYDYEGFSTFDSIVRTKEVFGFSQCIILSQKFHIERAITIAQYKGLDAIGYEAQDVLWSQGGWKTKVREYLARVKTILDIFILRR